MQAVLAGVPALAGAEDDASDERLAEGCQRRANLELLLPMGL